MFVGIFLCFVYCEFLFMIMVMCLGIIEVLSFFVSCGDLEVLFDVCIKGF